MKLSEREKSVLATVELAADMPTGFIAREVGGKPSQAGYILQKLQDEKIITPTIFVDMYQLGFSDYVLYFSSTSSTPMAWLLKHPNVTWVSELSGTYQYGVAMFARHVHEFVSFLDELSNLFGDTIIQKSVRLTKTFTRFNRKYLDPKAPIQSLSFGLTSTSHELTALDDQLLSTLSLNGSLSLREITRQLRVPLSTTHQRFQRLQEKKIIVGSIYSVDAPRFGATLFNVLVYAKGMRETLRKDLYAWSEKHPNVIHFVECVGEWDFEIGVEVLGPEHSTAIVQELNERFGKDLVKTETLPILRNLKYVFYRSVTDSVQRKTK